MNQNYQQQMDGLLNRLQKEQETKTLLLHSCCAPCSSYVLTYLSEYFEITLLYYNPCIAPEEEYRKRESEQKRLIGELTPLHPIHFLEGKYEPERYYDLVKGYETEKEGGARCEICYRMRLLEAAEAADRIGTDYFATTLTVSPLKNAEHINAIGAETEQGHRAKYLPSDFKKKGGYQKSVVLSKEYALYRQNYCGCIFSK